MPIKHAEEVEQVFDAISYCKGSAVVNMVATTLGPEKFREGLQLYMKRHAYGNTETSDLWAAWTEVSGIDVADVMSSWTTRMGYPYLEVVNEEWSADKVLITLRQAWFLADGSKQPGDEDVGIWKIPLIFASSAHKQDRAVIMSKKEETFQVALSGPNDWVKINCGQKALVRVAHSATMSKHLQPAISSKAVAPIDRAALLSDAFALAKAGVASITSVFDILKGKRCNYYPFFSSSPSLHLLFLLLS